MSTRYFRLSDDVYIPGRWELGVPTDPQGGHGARRHHGDEVQGRHGTRSGALTELSIPVLELVPVQGHGLGPLPGYCVGSSGVTGVPCSSFFLHSWNLREGLRSSFPSVPGSLLGCSGRGP